MKHTNIFALVVVLISLTSCFSKRGLSGGNSNFNDLYDGTEKFLAGRVENEGNFIVLKNGKKIMGDVVNLKFKNLKAEVRVDDTTFKASDVQIMQNEHGYFKRVAGVLAARFIKGRINCYKYYYTELQMGQKVGNIQYYSKSQQMAVIIEKNEVSKHFTINGLKKFLADSESAKENFSPYLKAYRRRILVPRVLFASSLAFSGTLFLHLHKRAMKDIDIGTKTDMVLIGTAGGFTLFSGIYQFVNTLKYRGFRNWSIIKKYNAEKW
jgi:hypothetical protein